MNLEEYCTIESATKENSSPEVSALAPRPETNDLIAIIKAHRESLNEAEATLKTTMEEEKDEQADERLRNAEIKTQ